MGVFVDESFTVNGRVFRGLRGGAGPCVLLLHGFSITADMWRLNLPALIEAGYSVLALDLPGHGASYRPARPMNVTDVARDLFAVLDALAVTEVRVVGNSFGGAVASEMALLQPERVRALVLVDALGFDPHIPVFRRARYWTHLILPSLAYIFGGGVAWPFAFQSFKRMIYFAPERVPEGVTTIRYPGGWRHNHLGRGLVGWGLLRQMLTHRRRLSFAQRRAAIRAPALIVWGMHDQLLPISHAYSAQALLPHARLRIFPRAGHAPNIEHAEAFNRDLIHFLYLNDYGPLL
jgi:pimeloyl-ACP methyl ester carboxylesterase